ncbi:hypothetical protein FRB99_000658 [Tulasnella sp. 403]|nr:hypothetical protein FRB99_000658 [Tulasnella sp. 403]
MIGINEKGVTVAVKVLRYAVYDDGQDQSEKIKSEAKVWEGLDHPNVLLFMGTAEDKDKHLYLISPWMENGSLKMYLPKHPDANRPRFLLETADALKYLHKRNVIHGDIKGSNILVSSGNEPHALLCDFGLSRRLADPTLPGLKGVGTVRWQAPELWDNQSKSFSTDSYSFGMTIYEVLTDNEPFHDCKTQGQLLTHIRENKRPPKEPEICPNTKESWTYLWQVAERCWDKDPEERPSMEAVYRWLESRSVDDGEAVSPSAGVSTDALRNIQDRDSGEDASLATSPKLEAKKGPVLELAG